jgi:lipoprotein-releasing system permease protein
MVAAIGVTFSITMFIALLGFMNGLNKMLDGLISNRTPHVRIYNDTKMAAVQPAQAMINDSSQYIFVSNARPSAQRKQIRNVIAIENSIENSSSVEGVTGKVSAQVFYTQGTTNIAGTITGIDPVKESKLFFFKEYVTKGNASDLENIPNSIIIGKGIADKLMIKIGNQIVISTANGEQFNLKVVGYFQSGIADIDKIQSYATIKTVQKLLNQNSTFITELHVKLKDIKSAPTWAAFYRNTLGVDAEDIQTANAQFETGSSVRSIISYAVGITLLIVAGFGIYNILNMMIYEKMDTIAILKAMGFAGKDVMLIFISISVSLGLVGGIAGLVFGYGLCVVIDNIPFVTAALPTINTYPIDFNPKYYFIAGSFAFITTYLAGFFPALKASKIDPVVILRGK